MQTHRDEQHRSAHSHGAAGEKLVDAAAPPRRPIPRCHSLPLARVLVFSRPVSFVVCPFVCVPFLMMLGLLLDIEIGVGELLTAVLVLGAGYLAWQWWNAQKVATSGVSGASAFALSPIARGAAAFSSPSASSSPVSDADKLPLAIFFGSQSGTAETFAHELAEEARAFGFRTHVHDLQDYDRDSLAEESFVVFLLATFGEGDPTDNAAEFYEWINQEEREAGSMKAVTFGVFALGNRQYEHFCNIGRRVDHRMAELGGTRLLEHGEGDDDGSLEDDFLSWKSIFWARTKATFGLAETSAAALGFKPSFAMDIKTPEAAAKYVGGVSPLICDPKHKPILASLVENRQLRSDAGAEFELQYNEQGESTRHLELDVSALRLSYVTADNLGVCPCNPSEVVDAMCLRMKLNPAMVFSLKAMGKRKAPVPSPCSVRDAFTWYLDFQSVPRAALLTTFLQYTNEQAEKDLLLSWTHDGKEDFYREERGILEVLAELPGLSIPFLDFLELCPKIQPRFYTISSSSLVQPKQVSITVALSTHNKTRGRVYHGLASTYLCALKPQERVCVFLRPSGFRLPKPKRTFVNTAPAAAGASASSSAAASSLSSTSVLPPILMVGPGTGVAPFRAFVQEFGYLRARSLPSFPETYLFFGCRHRDQDFIYQSEMESAVAGGQLTQLFTAFSRESGQKVYVQSDLKAHAVKVWKLISASRAYFYVCGSTLMGRQVKECVQLIAMEHGNMTQQAASEFVKKMTSEGRYIQELWS